MGYICANGAPLVMLLKRNTPPKKVERNVFSPALYSFFMCQSSSFAKSRESLYVLCCFTAEDSPERHVSTGLPPNVSFLQTLLFYPLQFINTHCVHEQCFSLLRADPCVENMMCMYHDDLQEKSCTADLQQRELSTRVHQKVGARGPSCQHSPVWAGSRASWRARPMAQIY